MGKRYEGSLLGKGLKFGLIASRFNDFFTQKLVEGAQDALLRHGVNEADIEIAWAPGSFEIPLVTQKMAQSKKYDALICLAAVIRGGTPHWEYIAAEATKGIARVSLETGVPVVSYDDAVRVIRIIAAGEQSQAEGGEPVLIGA